jgi:hypothetical protein
MSSFTTPLRVEANPDCKGWTLLEPFTYHIGYKDSPLTITVPKGFTTDFASVPNPLRGLIPQWGVYGKAAVLHDWLYFTKEQTRLEADNTFLEAMCALNTPRWQRFVMWLAVRTFGFLAWKERK